MGTRTLLAGLVLLLLSLLGSPTALAQSGWKDSHRQHFGFVIEVDGEVVGALVAEDWMHRKNRKELSFSKVFVYSEGFAQWLQTREGSRDLVVKRARPASGEEDEVIVLGGCMVMESEPVEVGEEDALMHTAHYTGSAKIGYTNIELVL